MERTTLSSLRRTKAFRIFASFTGMRTFATVIALIAGCGGPPGADPIDEPSVPVDPSAEVLTGVLGASPTAGVSYETASLSGVTSEDGSFEYREGESVRFFLGDTTLGESVGREAVTAFDLAGIEPLTTGSRGFEEARAQVSHAANAATLFQTLDYDADPTNGIEITPDVSALFDSVEVDLERDIFDFAQEQTFRSVLNRANEAELLDGYRRPRGGILVMNDLYTDLGLAPGFFAPRSVTVDEDGDGEIDTMREYVHGEQSSERLLTTFSTAAKQRATVAEFDENGTEVSKIESEEDGEVIFANRSVIDADGNLVLVSRDLLGDGAVEGSTTHLHDEFGRVLHTEHDDGADGTPDRVGSYEYDGRGNQSRFEWDSNVDGAPEQVELRVWSRARNLLGVELDADGDGWFESFEAFDYGEDGRLLGRAHYLDGEPDPSRVQVWDHDEAGRRIAQSTDDDGDGVFDRVQTWAYDSEGNETRLEYDFDADGSADAVVTYAYDADGNRIVEESDYDMDGIPEHITRRAFAPVGWGYLFYELRDQLALDTAHLR